MDLIRVFHEFNYIWLIFNLFESKKKLNPISFNWSNLTQEVNGFKNVMLLSIECWLSIFFSDEQSERICYIAIMPVCLKEIIDYTAIRVTTL